MNDFLDKQGDRGGHQASQASELSLLVACHSLVCAISTRFVTHLAVDADIELISEAGCRIIRSGHDHFAAFNLGTLLGLAPVTSAWVMLRIARPTGDVAIALQTGKCMVVGRVNVQAWLPPRIFTQRGHALSGAFLAGSQIGLEDTMPYGLLLDVAQFWSDAELKSAHLALGRHHGRN